MDSFFGFALKGLYRPGLLHDQVKKPEHSHQPGTTLHLQHLQPRKRSTIHAALRWFNIGGANSVQDSW